MKPFDEHLFNLKLQDACKDLHRETNARLKQVDGDQKKIGQGYGPGWLAKRMDAAIDVFHKDYVAKVDKACRETWLSDHDAVTPEFIRGILVPRLFSFVAARKSAIQGETELLARRTGIGTQLTPALHHLVHEINRVQGDLATRYEIEVLELAKHGAQVRRVTQAPAPPTVVGGLGIASSGPKPTQVPKDLPPYYPDDLRPQTRLILGRAIRKFPIQTQALELCLYVVSELTKHFVAAIQRKTLRPDRGEDRMNELLHYVLVSNCHNDRERFQLEQEARRSREWLTLSEEIASAAKELEHETSDVATKQPTHLQFVPHILFSNPLTAHDAGSSATVNIAAFRMRIASQDIPLNSGSITGLSYDTLYYVCFDDPAFAGGTVSYQATTERETALGVPGRFFVGSISTPERRASDTIGNADGGTIPLPTTRTGSLEAPMLASRRITTLRTPERTDPEVAKRRAIVKANRGVEAREMCEIFDRERVPLPTKWQDSGLRNWTQAYGQPPYPKRIDVMISKDRHDN